MEDIGKIIGARIKALRMEKGLSREQVARKCGITQQAIEKYEIGSVSLSIQRLEKIAFVLGKEVNYFLEN